MDLNIYNFIINAMIRNVRIILHIFVIGISIMTKNYEIFHNSSIPIITHDCDMLNNEYDTEFKYCHSSAFAEVTKDQTLNLQIKLSSIVYEDKKGISRLFDYITGAESKFTIAYIEDDETLIDYYDTHYIYDYNPISNNIEYNKKKYLKNSKCAKKQAKKNNEYNDEYGDEYNEYEYEENEYDEYEDENEDYYPREDPKFYHVATIMSNPISKYNNYKRNSISFSTVLANIGALFSTLNVVFAFIFRFYSKNFDNYQIVDKVLRSELSKNKNSIKINNINKQLELNEIKLKDKDKNISEPLISNISEKDPEKESDNINLEDKKLTDEENNENEAAEEQQEILPKLSFFDFYLNNLYFKCCQRKQKQDILQLCNNIVLKYASIDYILYNIIRLENLIQDYKWNDPNLNSIKNNELIKDLLKHM